MFYIKFEDITNKELNMSAKQYTEQINHYNFIVEIDNLRFEINYDFDRHCFYIVNDEDACLLFNRIKQNIFEQNFKKLKTLFKTIYKELKNTQKDIQKGLTILKDK